MGVISDFFGFDVSTMMKSNRQCDNFEFLKTRGFEISELVNKRRRSVSPQSVYIFSVGFDSVKRFPLCRSR